MPAVLPPIVVWKADVPVPGKDEDSDGAAPPYENAGMLALLSRTRGTVPYPVALLYCGAGGGVVVPPLARPKSAFTFALSSWLEDEDETSSSEDMWNTPSLGVRLCFLFPALGAGAARLLAGAGDGVGVTFMALIIAMKPGLPGPARGAVLGPFWLYLSYRNEADAEETWRRWGAGRARVGVTGGEWEASLSDRSPASVISSQMGNASPQVAAGTGAVVDERLLRRWEGMCERTGSEREKLVARTLVL